MPSTPDLNSPDLNYDAGFNKESKLVTAAIHRHEQNLIDRVLFDWTCQWGASPLRPLLLVGWLSMICTMIYWVGLHFRTRGGLFMISTGERVKTGAGKQRAYRISLGNPARINSEIRALGTAFTFSLMSVFSLGFHDFNIGVWIRMLQPRDFDIRAGGWMRTVSGLQSLIGLGLVALSLLSYFGQPFD
jgi:hypothetical protein